MNKATSEIATEYTNDFNKELKQKSSLNLSNEIKSVVDHHSQKSPNNSDKIHEKESSIKVVKKKLNDSSINTNETYERNHPNRFKNIIYPVSNSNINLKNYRFDNFKHLREKLDKVREFTVEQKNSDFNRIFKHTNKERNTNVINEINSLLVNIDNIKTKHSFSPDIKDSLLNSYKDFVAVNRQTKFLEGASILDLKKDAFIQKIKLLDVKLYLNQNRHEVKAFSHNKQFNNKKFIENLNNIQGKYFNKRSFDGRESNKNNFNKIEKEQYQMEEKEFENKTFFSTELNMLGKRKTSSIKYKNK